jgi:hypothetical protein
MIAHSYPALMRHARIVHCDGTLNGLRQVDASRLTLQVRAAPYRDRKRMLTAAPAEHFTYVVDTADGVYMGSGNCARNIGERIRAALLAQSQVFIIFSLDPHWDSADYLKLENRIVNVADELGVPLLNGMRPLGRNGLRPDPCLAQLVDDAIYLLAVAGFRRFEEVRQSNKPRRIHVSATADLHDIRVIPPGEIEIPTDAIRVRLVHKGVHAHGYRIGKRLLVLPGADYCQQTKSGLSVHNRNRRSALAQQPKIFENIPGVTDRARLRLGLDCKSPHIAATMIAGKHLGSNAWEAVAAPTADETSGSA